MMYFVHMPLSQKSWGFPEVSTVELQLCGGIHVPSFCNYMRAVGVSLP